MKTPAGIIVICVFMALLSVSGTLGFIGTLSEAEPMLLIISSFIYASAALVSVLGLWGMRYWGLIALRVWMLNCLFFMFFFALAYNHQLFTSSIGFYLIALFLAAFFYFIDRYVKKSLAAASASN